MTTQTDRLSIVAPRERAAAAPPEARGLARDEVRLLVAGAELAHARFRELPDQLRPGDLVVVNNSATMCAAVDATLDGEPVVLHFSTWLDDGRWVVEVRTTQRTPYPAQRLTPGTALHVPGAAAILRGPWLPGAQRLWVADISTDVPRLLAAYGRPITYSYVPHRWSASYYATVFGRVPGSAEMPSAARPFTERLVLDLIASGIAFTPITLHTGVSSAESGEPPSPERFVVPTATARLVNTTKAAGGRVVAVGTTVTRALETAADPSGQVHAADGWTDLVLGADRTARVVDGLITGWHAPGASHLDLLVAVAGEQKVAAVYAVAVDAGYLWHEFGDSALLFGAGT
ncbi:S-adenosylmethionine:tRNA ribosyltransferase-isomerase [Nocardia sp. R6R-6]|uniref:S-adenosylmethionine:tRNA ribosyltransferase-isomerase n=1 Tax=Nocardia sp. R6R-6 TaxID=3459303 RepID=UPI00403DB555